MYKSACLMTLLFLISTNALAGTAKTYETKPQSFERKMSKATDLNSIVYTSLGDDFKKGLKAISEGRYVKAERLFRFDLNERSTCNTIPVDIMTRYCKETAIRSYYLGFALMAQGQFGEAIPYLKEASALDPKTPEFAGALSIAYRNNGDVENANALTQKLTDDLKLSGTTDEKRRIKQAILDSQFEVLQ